MRSSRAPFRTRAARGGGRGARRHGCLLAEPLQVRTARLPLRPARSRPPRTERPARLHGARVAGASGRRLLRSSPGCGRRHRRGRRDVALRARSWAGRRDPPGGPLVGDRRSAARLQCSHSCSSGPRNRRRSRCRPRSPRGRPSASPFSSASSGGCRRRRVSPRADLIWIAKQAVLAAWAGVEEIVWRALLLAELARVVGVPAALGVSSVGFALWHPSRRRLHLLTGLAFGAAFLVAGLTGGMGSTRGLQRRRLARARAVASARAGAGVTDLAWIARRRARRGDQALRDRLRPRRAVARASSPTRRSRCSVPNGAGKSTLIALLLGLRRPDAGIVRLLGENPRRGTTRAAVGYAPQDVGFPPTLKVREIADLVARHFPDAADPAGLLDRFGVLELAAPSGRRALGRPAPPARRRARLPRSASPDRSRRADGGTRRRRPPRRLGSHRLRPRTSIGHPPRHAPPRRGGSGGVARRRRSAWARRRGRDRRRDQVACGTDPRELSRRRLAEAFPPGSPQLRRATGACPST